VTRRWHQHPDSGKGLRGNPSWEALVPAAAAEMIKAKNLFAI
jgi:hypothetical protein